MKRGCLICDSPLLFLFREMPRHRIELWTRGFSDKNPWFPNILESFKYLKSLFSVFHAVSDFFQFWHPLESFSHTNSHTEECHRGLVFNR